VITGRRTHLRTILSGRSNPDSQTLSQVCRKIKRKMCGRTFAILKINARRSEAIVFGFTGGGLLPADGFLQLAKKAPRHLHKPES